MVGSAAGRFLVWRVRYRAVVPVCLFLAAALYMFRETPLDSKAANNPDLAFRELGLGLEFKPYLGKNAFQFPNQSMAELWFEASTPSPAFYK